MYFQIIGIISLIIMGLLAVINMFSLINIRARNKSIFSSGIQNKETELEAGSKKDIDDFYYFLLDSGIKAELKKADKK